MRIRVHFAKTEAMRYTSHLDLHRAWERTIRRAGLPLAYTQGFRPHPRINLGAALPLGFTSQDEIVDIWLEEPLSLEQIHPQLTIASPPGIQILVVVEIPQDAPVLQTQITASKYLITLLEPISDLDVRLQHVYQATSLPRERRGKTYDLKPLIHEICRLPDDEFGRQRLQAVLSAREGATGRPEEVILALGGVPELVRVHRSGLIFTD
jgi:radical SAM-linked protein